MGHFLDIALKVLKKEGKSLSAKLITKISLENK